MSQVPSERLAGATAGRSLHGYGLRVDHYAELLARGVRADICEALTENFLDRGGRPLAVLERVRREVPITLHGVSLSVGATDDLSLDYLIGLKKLVERFEPCLISDHLCFGSVGGHRAYDLWPLPYTEEALQHVVERVGRVQDFLGRKICLENVSSYLEYCDSSLSEWEFLAAVSERADCELLLDVNNVFVSARNHSFSAEHYVDALPPNRVAQLHLAGHSVREGYLLDDHGSSVPEEVWQLYRHTRARLGPRPTLIEWDTNLPSLERLEAECRLARDLECDVAG